MKVHNEPDWHPTHQWWVTWNNYRVSKMPAQMRQQTTLIMNFKSWFDTNNIRPTYDSNLRGNAGYGFKQQNEAMLFFLRWQNESIGLLD
jgi:hypothetical protein